MTSIAPVTAPPVTTTNAPTADAFSQLSGNFNTFISLLTAQLQNQDPLAPTDASTFTQQLVEYSQVEQQIGTNDKLDKVIGTLSTTGGQQYLNYIGTTIDANSSQAILRNGSSTVGYKLPDNASDVEIKISKNGQLIRTLSGDETLGSHSVVWDGKNELGTQQNSGAYDFTVTAKNSSGAAMTGITQFITAPVIGIAADATNGAQLDIGDGYTISPSQVYSVRDSAAASQDDI